MTGVPSHRPQGSGSLTTYALGKKLRRDQWIRLHYPTGGEMPPIVMAHEVTDAGPVLDAGRGGTGATYDATTVDARARPLGCSRGWSRTGPRRKTLPVSSSASGLDRPGDRSLDGRCDGASTCLDPPRTAPCNSLRIPAWWTECMIYRRLPECCSHHEGAVLRLRQKTRAVSACRTTQRTTGWLDASSSCGAC